MDIEKNKSYLYPDLQKYADANNYSFLEHDFTDSFRIGLSVFCIYDDEEDDVVGTFIVESHTNKGAYCKCVYTDK